MKLNKKISFFLFFLFFFLLSAENVLGRDSLVTVVNPVRGNELSDLGNPFFLEGVNKLLAPLSRSKVPATWLLRYDAFTNNEGTTFFKKLVLERPEDELGIFLEITPKLAEQAGVGYPSGGVFWHDANKIFLSGYKPQDRIKLIDKVFQSFYQEFGKTPVSVGAWHIDAYSAGYMQEKYGITGVLICADQFGTDGYQIWGGWWGVPYYPSKYNILIPAQTQINKIDAVVFWWAARDPNLGYGGSVRESTYSVQTNDYLSHGLDAVYFSKLMNDYLFDSRNQFGQLTIGLENDNNWQKLGDKFDWQIEAVKQEINNGSLRAVTMADFSQWYRKKYNSFSPDHWVGGWKMSTDYRIGLSNSESKEYIRDLRIYNEEWPEANLLSANPWRTLSLNNPYKIDTIRFNDSAKIADFEINKDELTKRFGSQKIPFKSNNLLFLLFYSFTLLLLVYFLKNNLPLLVLVVVGSVSLFLPMIKSGLVYPFGMGFWGPNGHDGIWHLALINQLKNFSLSNPVFSGTRLTNYHFGFDLIVALISRLTTLSPLVLYFQIAPLIMAVLIGVLTYKFVVKWVDSKKSAWWATFFVYFGGSWGWLLGRGESTFWANQSVSSLINPPYALSLIVLLLGLIKLLDYFKTPNKKNLIVCSLLFGILIQIKVYVGIIAVGSLFCLLFITLIFNRSKFKEIFYIFLGSFLVAAIIFLPFNLNASSLLVFSPLWFPRSMISFSDRLGWFKLENARITYLNSGKWFKWVLAEGLALSIFIFGNLGTRAVGFFYGGFVWKKRKINPVELVLFSALTISLVLPLLFIQKGNPWNTIQFFYYFQFLMAIFAGVTVGNLFGKTGKLKKIAIGVFLVILTLPTTLITLKNDYLPSRAPARISIEELEALDFLKKQTEGTVLTFPYNFDWKVKFSEPRPLYAYETTAYVSALSAHRTFLEDEMNLEITSFDWKSRKAEVVRFFLTADQLGGKTFLQENKIKYIYLVEGQKMNLGLNDIGAEKIFENGEVSIFRVK